MNAAWLKPLRPWLRRPGVTRRASLIAMTAVACTGSAAGLLVPGFTAYTEPDADGARVSQHGNGVTHWTDPELKVVWFGQFEQTGEGPPRFPGTTGRCGRSARYAPARA